MKSLVLVIVFTAVVTGSLIQKPPITTIKDLHGELLGSRIISGQPAVAGQFPWQVASSFKTGLIGSSFCGGALICDSWVLTAAHCARGGRNFNLYFGSVNKSEAVESRRVELLSNDAIVHERYNSIYLNNDIALIRLPEKVNASDRIRYIPLGNVTVGVNVTLTVSGWGKTSDDSNNSPILNYVNLTSISNQNCTDVYGQFTVINSTLCCQGRPEQSPCQGDSGGPLVQQLPNGQTVHVGIVSFVHNSGCESGKPSGYVRTGNYIDWIKDKIKGTCQLPTID